ncbi:MAG: methyltransferase [Alphaproteobacteria bacterium]|nr:methyltransferase [Alphaproteobacteria bacterium]
MTDHKEIFNNIYSRDLWGGGSGPGSTPEHTHQYRWYLQNFMRANRITSVLDIGCGDWQFSKMIDWTGVNYIGLDVSDVVLQNTRTYARSNITFLEANALKDELPKADLAILKDIVMHWSNAEIISFVPKLQNFKFALITNGLFANHPESINIDIQTGQWRSIDLTMPPFSFKGANVYWYPADGPKTVFLWKRDE